MVSGAQFLDLLLSPLALAPVAHPLNGSRLRREKNNSFGAALNQRCLSRPLRHPLGDQDRIYFCFYHFTLRTANTSIPCPLSEHLKAVLWCRMLFPFFNISTDLRSCDYWRKASEDLIFFFFLSFCFFYCSSPPRCEMWPLIRFLRAASTRSSCSTTTRSLCICVCRHCVWLWVNHRHNSCCLTDFHLVVYFFFIIVGHTRKHTDSQCHPSQVTLRLPRPILTPVHLSHLLKSPPMCVSIGLGKPVGVLIGHVFENIFCWCNT